MWRRAASLSSLIFSSSQPLRDQQGAYSLKAWKFFCADSSKGAGYFSKEKNLFITFVLGGPGSGKGTQCAKIVENFGYTHLSAGELLRREIASNSEDGAMLLDTIKEGKIVPSEVTVKLIQKEMESCGNCKFLIDGFPRNEENRIAFEQIGRVDDNIDTIRKRLKVFAASHHPVIEHYSKKGKLYKIDAIGTEDEIFERVRPVFAACEGAQ
ncbi:UMP-CMP kinase isoform X3 [Rhodamnia argentea]|uniref:adenylate kinase n=1 Tax=Rhodamnia argentea TaxID=178133 RepID=A0ABM3GTJ2_9MYRT|nr:UMP-CMP kinase isoform X3 [Rhodamnia argentea]